MADEEDTVLDGKPISELRVVDLKKELDKRGLSKIGSKAQLTDRLKTVRFIFACVRFTIRFFGWCRTRSCLDFSFDVVERSSLTWNLF